MIRGLKNLLLLGVSAIVSYLLLLHRPPTPSPAPAPEATPSAVEIAVAPAMKPSPEPEPEPEPESEPEPERVSEPTPPPPDLGTPEGTEDETAAPDAAKLREEIDQLQSSTELVEQAAAEVAGEARKGLQTVFLCAARDQAAIARAFREPLVLVPRAGLGGKTPHYFRYRAGDGVERVNERPPLERFRQYRNLFRFPYEDLPPPLRELRRSVPNRGDVYLFAALIPPAEWAVVIARRAAALAAHRGQGRTPADLRRVTLRYVRLPGGGFDIRVAELLFADGARWNPPKE